MAGERPSLDHRRIYSLLWAGDGEVPGAPCGYVASPKAPIDSDRWFFRRRVDVRGLLALAGSVWASLSVATATGVEAAGPGFRYWLIRSERKGVRHVVHWTQSVAGPSVPFGLDAGTMREVS